MAAVALALPLDEIVVGPHLGPAEASDGGIAHIGGVEPYLHVWYSVPPDTRACALCDQPIREGNERAVAIMPDDEWRWAHALCTAKVAGGVTAMATYKNTMGLPDCRMCGRSWDEHYRPITTVFDAYCDTEGPPDVIQYWRPAEPFRSRNWPYGMIIDSPRYTPDGKTAYAAEATNA